MGSILLCGIKNPMKPHLQKKACDVFCFYFPRTDRISCGLLTIFRYWVSTLQLINLNIYLSDFKMCFIVELGKIMFMKLLTTGIVLHIYIAGLIV